MVTLYVESIPTNEDECPEIRGRVRGKIFILGFIFKARFDADLQKEVTDMFFVTCLDINGSVPKWLINKAAGAMPKSWLGMFERECQRY